MRFRRRRSASLWLLQAARALASGDSRAAFDEEHSIKGVILVALASKLLFCEVFKFVFG